MARTTMRNNMQLPAGEPELHQFHSATEVDESHENWRDWVGPILAVLALVGALTLLFLASRGAA